MSKKSPRLRLRIIAISLLVLILVSSTIVSAEKPDHTKTTVTSTVKEDYDGKTIEVTGELQEYDGPEIILYHPYQVEVLN